ncbi:MAG: hypothetical protein JXQ30_08790 [Spirochaetes bacterium]|nr:hypothetical protein [Spirochaetota bacterium]
MGTLANKKFSKWTAEDCDKASTVCASYTTSGAMLKLGLIDKDMLEEWRLSVKTCFKICKPLIDKLRKIIGPEYWIEFEKLYNKLNQDRQSY